MRFDSFAPEYEDIILYAILKDIPHGFYIDVGANDPLSGSVTKFFYDRGWHGINVEPLRSGCLLFDEQRPRDINLCVGVSNTEEAEVGSLPFYPAGGCSTFDDAVADAANFTKGNSHLKQIMTLTEIYRVYSGGAAVHFCKIDVEGYERKVLEGIVDWELFRPWVFCMEATKPQTLIPSHEEWEHILLRHGYVFAYHFGVNRYYVDRRREHLLDHANQLDVFFEENEVTRVRVFGRPRKRLKERLAIFGLGREFAENRDRIVERSYVVCCLDNYHVPEEPLFAKKYVKPENLMDFKWDKVLIATKRYYPEIREQLLDIGVSAEQIVDIEYLRFDKL